jgi:hypothetical protein
MNSHRITNSEEEDGALWRRLVLSEEDRLRLFPGTVRPGGYRWFRSENVVCLEHFRGGRALTVKPVQYTHRHTCSFSY